MLREIQAENENKVAAMTDVERQRELQDLQETFSPKIMEMLAQRAQRRAQQAQAPPRSESGEVSADKIVPVMEQEPATSTASRTVEPIKEDRSVPDQVCESA